MKKVQGNLLHGCRVSRTVIFLVLIMEYIIFFLKGLFSWKGCLLLLGYVLLTVMITCNNHGKNVRLRYEQEMSLTMKCLITNLIMGIFLQAAVYEGDWRSLLWLSMVQLGSILLICIQTNEEKRNTGKKFRLYIYEGRKPDIADVPYAETVSGETDAAFIREKLLQADTVYLYDINASRRNYWMKYCFQIGKPVFFTTKLSDMELRSAVLAQDGDVPVFYLEGCGRKRGISFLKRFFDVLFSCVLLIFSAPLLALIAVFIKWEDGGPVFYRQIRCTKDMKKFYIIKFRSMIVGAESMSGVRLAGRKDSRMTRVGYFLRKYKLDELPQLINILKGDMSFVGPRPERPELISEIIKDVPEFSFRTTVQAGLTGYAQVHGDYHTEFLDKLKWDLMYIENYSLLLDLKIILMTIPAVLRGSDDVS